MDPKKLYEAPGLYSDEISDESIYTNFYNNPVRISSAPGDTSADRNFVVAPEHCQEECVISSSLPNQYAKIELDTSVIQKEISPNDVAPEALLHEQASSARTTGAVRKATGSNLGYDAWENIVSDDPSSLVNNVQDSSLDQSEENSDHKEQKYFFTDPNFIFAIFCLIMAAHSSASIGFFSVILPILENSFGFTSLFGGLMNMFLNFSICLCGVWLGVKKFKSPLFCISIGAFFIFSGCVLMTVPMLLRPSLMNVTRSDPSLCREHSDLLSSRTLIHGTCDIVELNKNQEKDKKSLISEWIFFAGFICIGIGSAPLFTLIPSIIDKVIEQEYTSIYFALYYLISLLSVAGSYVTANLILASVADKPHTENEAVGIDNSGASADIVKIGDERWWWLYIISGSMSLIAALAGLYANKYFKNPKYLSYQTTSVTNVFDSANMFSCESSSKKQKESEKVSDNSGMANCGCWHCTTRLYAQAKYTIDHVAEMFCNKSFLMISIANMLLQGLVSAHSIYLPKYMHFKFEISVERAGMLLGAALVIGGSTGSLLGGFALKYRRLEKNNTVKFLWAICAISCAFIASFYVSCSRSEPVTSSLTSGPTTDINLNEAIVVSSFTPFLEDGSHNGCSQKCKCSLNEYVPVCYSDKKIQISSPCVAGCKNVKIKDKLRVYTDCKCVIKEQKVEMTLGTCQGVTCKETYFFVTILMFFNILIFMTYVPMTKATLRSLSTRSSPSLAFGIQQILQRMFGQTLGPLVLAKMMDLSCSHWRIDECTKQASNCLKYDESGISHKMFIYSISLMILSCLSLLFADSCKSESKQGYRRLGATVGDDDIMV